VAKFAGIITLLCFNVSKLSLIDSGDTLKIEEKGEK